MFSMEKSWEVMGSHVMYRSEGGATWTPIRVRGRDVVDGSRRVVAARVMGFDQIEVYDLDS